MPRVDIPNPDTKVIQGSPQHGDVHTDAAPPADPPADPPASSDPVLTAIEELRAANKAMSDELTHLRRFQPMAQPKEPPATQPPKEEEVDWDQEFFASPKKALQKHADLVRRQVTTELEGRYQRDRSTQAFWDQFYEKHPDLKTDHDLVDLTLKSNLAEMGSMPVDKAMDRLADLTRDRILRYAGGAAKQRNRPKVEGSGVPSKAAPKPVETSDQVLSITDLIRQRRDRRRKAAGA